MIWKVLYDFRRPNWQAFGHVLFVEADSQCQAESLGLRTAAMKEDGATISRVDVSSSNSDARTRHDDRVERQRQWLMNVTHGTPNPKGLL